MSGLANALVIVAVVALVIARQFRARAIDTDRRWWIVPVVLAALSLSHSGILDPHHRIESGALLVVELLLGVAIGAGWGWTSRVWTAPDGVVWAKSSTASAAVWGVGIALRIGLFALGTALGLHQDSSVLMLGFAATLLVRGAVLAWRAQSLGPAARPVPAYGDGVRSAGKERV
ncbi:DUF1453 domain-containing protein [Streptomyces sp. NPDC001606]